MTAVGTDKSVSSRLGISSAKLTGSQLGMICLLYAYGFLLGSVLPIGQVGQFFYVIACAELLAALMRNGTGFFRPTVKKSKLCRTPDIQEDKAQSLTIAICWLSAAVVFLTVAPPVVLIGSPFANFSILALASLVFSISSLPEGRGKFQLTATHLTFFRFGLSGLLTLIGSLFWQVDLQSLLALHLFATILVLGLALFNAERSNDPRGSEPGVLRFQNERNLSLSALVCRYSDIWVVGWLLAPIEALIYLNARLIVSILDVVICATLRSFSKSLSVASGRENLLGDNALTARMNLGLLLIGGGTAVALLAIFPTIVPLIPTDQIDAKPVALWLLLASSAPAIWGATDLFLQFYSHKLVHWFIYWCSAALICMLPFISHADSALEVATIYAAVRITLGGVAAVYASITLGFLPGFTAILHRQLRMI